MLDTILFDSLAGAYVSSRRSAVFPEMSDFMRKDGLRFSHFSTQMRDAASQKYCCLRQKSGTSVQVPPSALAHSTSCFADRKPWNVETFPN